MNNQLSTDLFYGMILSGAKQIIVNENELNQLNVFPVADRDTGTNLASMMRYIVDNLSPTKDTVELLHQLSQHGLIGSSGNSGLIFSQFFYGLTTSNLHEKTIIKFQDLVVMFNNGYKSAYESVSSPKPGTILSVMERLAMAAHDLAHDTKITLVDGFKIAVEKSRETLKDSINQLEVLRQNNVVDAGAQGFIYFIDGMLRFLRANEGERLKILAEKNSSPHEMLKMNFEFEDLSDKPNYRYCFETVVKVESINIIEAQSLYLETLGDSMVIGRGNNMAKLHIHTNQPELVTAKLSNYGEILYQKIDDMLLQYSIASSKTRNKIAIITDTMADLPQEWLWQKDIVSIPLQVKVNGSAYLDKYSINYRQVLSYMNNASNKVCTAAPSAAVVARNLHFLEQFYESFIIISVAKSLSSTYDVIVNQARKFHSRHVSVIDSCTNSASLGLLVTYANQLVESKEYTHNQIVEELDTVKSETNILILLNSLDGLIRSGRLSKSLGYIARFLKLKPIVSFDTIGKPHIVGVSLTKRGAWSKMIQMINKLQKQERVNSLAIVHSCSEKVADIFGRYITKKSGLTPIYTTEVSAVAGVHTAENSLAVAYSIAKITS